MPSTVLVRVSGSDRPGITAGLMEVLNRDDVGIIDVEQVVVRGRLDLSVLIEVPEGNATIKNLLFYAWEHGVQVDFDVVEGEAVSHDDQWVVTLIAPRVTPAVFGAVATAVADSGGNIDRIVRIASYPVQSYELAVSGGDVEVMRRALGAAASVEGFDVAVQAEDLNRRAKRLVVLDVDSTLIQNEVIDLLAEEAGVGDETADITRRAMSGELDFEAALRQRVGLLRGTPVSVIDAVASRIQLSPGARTFVRTLKRLGMKVAIVSGGFTVFTDRLKRGLDLDHAVANVLEVQDGMLTGAVIGDIIDREAKADVLEGIAELEGIPLGQVVAIGDGANDIDMLAAAGLGIAFNAKPIVREAADTAVSVPYLDAILFLFGIRRGDVEAADADDGSIGV